MNDHCYASKLVKKLLRIHLIFIESFYSKGIILKPVFLIRKELNFEIWLFFSKAYGCGYLADERGGRKFRNFMNNCNTRANKLNYEERHYYPHRHTHTPYNLREGLVGKLTLSQYSFNMDASWYI